MAGSVLGNIFKISTWGESHGKGTGVIVDGCPAGIPLDESIIQKYLNRRKPGTSCYSTPRKEDDHVEILSGIFEGYTTGCPISMAVYNTSQRSHDYHNIKNIYRPGHADYTFDQKYGFRDYRGGGRSSGRETIARVAGGALAQTILKELGIEIIAYTYSIGPISIDPSHFDYDQIMKNPLYMPDKKAAQLSADYLQNKIKEEDSSGGIIECVIKGLPAGIGEPVFEKLDANLAKAIMSIGAVKGFEIGAGFKSATMNGSTNNDSFYMNENKKLTKKTNHAGGILGGISDGSEILLRAALKPTPSISQTQKTVNQNGENVSIQIKGRHDPIVVPRAVVVVECMTAITITDLLFINMASKMNKIKDFYLS